MLQYKLMKCTPFLTTIEGKNKEQVYDMTNLFYDLMILFSSLDLFLFCFFRMKMHSLVSVVFILLFIIISANSLLHISSSTGVVKEGHLYLSNEQCTCMHFRSLYYVYEINALLNDHLVLTSFRVNQAVLGGQDHP